MRIGEIEDVFLCAAKLGYDAVELAPFTLAESVVDISPIERDRIRKAADTAKIEIAGLHWLLVSPKGLHVNHPDRDIREKTRDYFFALIACCADLGGKIMVIGSPNERNVLDPLTPEQAWSYAQETFAACAEFAQEQDVILCMEPLASQAYKFYQYTGGSGGDGQSDR